jgi:hypothetical protein
VIDPKVFDASPYAPWPNKGARVRCKPRTGRSYEGVVTCVWYAMDAIAIDVLDDEGKRHGLFREFGDTVTEI